MDGDNYHYCVTCKRWLPCFFEEIGYVCRECLKLIKK